jgi:uncharacterized protein (DUF58 family)
VKRFLLLSVLVYLLLVLALALLKGSVLALILPLVVYLGAALLFGPDELQLRVERTLSADRVHKDTPVTVSLSVTNEGATLDEILIQDLVPRPLEPLVGDPEVLTTLRSGETIDLQYTLIGKRGSYDFRHIRVTAHDRLGIFRQRAVLQAPVHLWVLPERLSLRRVSIRPRRTRGYAGPVPARVGGSGTDFFGIREYQVGDPRRWINWRVSARHAQTLFSNEFEQERLADVGLILDARRRTDVSVDGDSLFEHAVGATAALAEAFLRDGNRVGLLIYGQFLAWTFPGYGKVQRERILQALAGARTGESQIFEKLDYLPTRFFPAQSQIVLVSPLLGEDLPMLLRLRARGYQLLVVRPDPVSFEARRLEPGPEVALAARIVDVERALLLQKLHHAGVRVVDWPVDRPFDQVIHASLGRMPHWLRAVGMER